MKNILLFVFFLLSFGVFAQTVCPTIVFSYDASGNRIQRTLSIIPCNEVQKQINGENTGEPIVISSMQVNVHPNPAKDKIIIEFLQIESPEERTTIFLYDVNGKEVYYEETSFLQVQIDVSKLSSGTYLLKIVRGKEFKTYNVFKN